MAYQWTGCCPVLVGVCPKRGHSAARWWTGHKPITSLSRGRPEAAITKSYTRRQTLHAAGGLLALATTSGASAFGTPTAPRPTINGWHEALLIVEDVEPWVATLRDVGGWEVAFRSRPDTSLNVLWSLPETARSEQVLMRNVGTSFGFLRLIKVSGVAQRRIRIEDQAWETGGFQALDFRVVDLEATRTLLLARGWRATSDPVRYRTYNVEVVQWAPTSPDGIRFSFIQRISPPLTGWPELKRWSRVTNAAMTVHDMESAARFFGDGLGLRQASHSDTLGSGGHNVMGLPWRVAESTPVDIRGFMGSAPDGGAIELISLPQLQGRDYAAGARPPNLGIAAVRFIVSDLSALAKRFASVRIKVVAQPTAVNLAPYGHCKVLAVQSPDGAWLEFLEIGR